jgi:dipeptidyl-peptidase 4
MKTTIRHATRIAAVCLAAAVVTLDARQANPVSSLRAQIDKIFKTRDYTAPRFGPARWLPDGTAYAIVEAASGGAGSEIVRYDASTGARSVLVPATKLMPPSGTSGGRKVGLEIDDYQWAPDGKRLLIFTNTRKVWRQNTRGDYWVLDLNSGGLKKLGGSAPESSLMFAKFSPDGTRVGYVRANNIYVEQVATGAITSLTSDGSETTINGTTDWVYEEELDLRDAFRWSPDSKRIAYWQFDSTGVEVFSLINDTAALYPTVTRIPYPKAGTTNSAVRVGTVSADGGPTQWMKVPGDPRQHYLARMDWRDANTLAIQQLNRLQNEDNFYLADVSTGVAKRVFHDQSQAWVDVVEDIRWIAATRSGSDGRANGADAFLWISERDGWRHVYRVPASGGEGTLITRFEADVIEVVGTDEESGWLYFLASLSNATERYLYRSKLDGSGAPERVTPSDQPGWHTYALAPRGQMAFHTWSQFDRPPVIDVVALPPHRSLRGLTDPKPLQAKLGDVITSPVEFFNVDVGNHVVLDGWMLKPPAFDASRKYPVIVFVYGEPAGQTVTNRWGSGQTLFNRALANAGYVVVSFDNRGTPAPKGAAWRKVVYGSVGDLSSKEQAAAIRALAERHAFIDSTRVGIWGWSGGGTNTLNAMFRFPDIYKVGVAVAPVPDQRLYDTIYQERYMGLPSDNEAGYRAGSAINFAEGLKGRLLVIHGSGDDNVHYQGTERLVNRLVELGKPFDLMVYPNRTHSISEGPGTSEHVYQLIARYFVEHLPL